MAFDQTQQQSSDEEQRARALSLKRHRPPTSVPGYEPKRFLGAGAYGEVWVAVDTNTGRQVAIKFYAHRGGLDWSLLSREVEKLAFLSADRYVVQLLDVGWEAEPPYYVMEYIERGSLEDLLIEQGKLAPNRAAAMFREVAVGLLHAHGKGVLHCDLKPANVLLDQDSKPRLADFGQSRLSHEQTPALGTLFYMAPEQADSKALPDVRWDVYALGALLYCMLTGTPPHRGESALAQMDTAVDLDERLQRYRKLIETAPPPSAHRQVPGVDRALADIVDRCLAVDRHERFANVQAVLDALAVREARRARWPLVMLGAIGPALVLMVMSLFAWRSFETVLAQADTSLKASALESNKNAAKAIAKTVTNELERRYAAVEEMAASSRFQALVEKTLDDPELARLRAELNDPEIKADRQESLREEFLANPARLKLQQRLQKLYTEEGEPEAASWFVTDASGLQLARAPESSTIGHNFGWRSYFTGENEDHPRDWRPTSRDHLTKTHLSRVFLSASEDRWSVAISTPLEREVATTPERDEESTPSRFLGVLAMTVEIGEFVQLHQDKQFAVLMDLRGGRDQGMILEHPLFDTLHEKYGKVPDRFLKHYVDINQLPDEMDQPQNYVDPLGEDPEGGEYRKHWLAKQAVVGIRSGNTGWIVIVQEPYDSAIGRVISNLRSNLAQSGILAIVLIAVLWALLWIFVVRQLSPKAA